LPLAGVVAARDRIMAIRGELGLSGPFPVYAQAVPPETIDAARQLAHAYRDAGIDGIILSESRAREAGFPKDDDVSRALVEEAAG
jgi:predicted TIM-barrel enzyme